MKIDIIGVYRVKSRQPCHLIELHISNHRGPLDVGAFTQEWPDKDRGSWQCPWDERVLDSEGKSDLLGQYPRNIVVDEELRLTFFMHYLNWDFPLITPAGELELPDSCEPPARLSFIQYEEPD
ncbi:hypothetical protein [Aeoliella sp. SH292]|uniref:hypothetical protein n=1 Tax=Aeoliella sp. SH292 TaxID=3454464 RepID=UPI003F9CD24A